MSLDAPNGIYKDSEYDRSLKDILDVYIANGDEFALDRFIDNYYRALDMLRFVSSTDGRPSDKTLRELGLRRIKIKRSKYIILYTYRDGVVILHSVQYGGRDFARIFNS